MVADGTHLSMSDELMVPTQSMDQFGELIEALPDAMVFVNTGGEIVLVNGQAELLFGYSRAELLGQHIDALVPERFRDRHAGQVSRYADTPSVRPMGRNLELFGRHRDGSEFPVEISLSPAKTEQGMFFASTIRDVTDRKRSDAVMRTLSSVVESSSDAIFSCAVEGTITTWNAGAECVFGYTADEAVGRSASLVLHDVALDTNADSLVRSMETKGHLKNGSTVDISLSVSFVYDSDGVKIGISCIARDISEIKRSRRATDTDRVRLAAVQESAHVGSFEIDLVTGERWWSDELWRILGADKTQGASWELLLARVHPEDRDQFEKVWQHIDSGEHLSEDSYRIQRPSGEVRWVRSFVSFDYAEDGSLERVLGTTLDVTDLHRADMQRLEAETNFQLSFDLSPIGMGLVDLDGRFQRVNLAICEIFGRTEEELLGKRTRDFLSPEDARNRPWSRSSAHLRPGEAAPISAERRHLRPNGDVVWTQETVSPIPSADGGHAYSLVQLQDITARRQAEESLKYQVFHDMLTGLGNRLQLNETLERALAGARESGGQVGVIFLDTDQFKMINDGLGHSAGDQLLAQLARRLQSMVRPTDMVARFGGDEFVIVCENITEENIERLVKRILASGEDPFVLRGQEVFVTMSVGIMLANGDEDAGSVLRNADTAMYQAKNDGRGQAIMFREEMHQTASSRLDLESRLGSALDKNELRVYYQPIVDILTEEVVGFEALVRWIHPKRGLILPFEFILVAEEAGTIIPIGEWVLRQTLAQAPQWHAEAPGGTTGLWVSVNVSTTQLQDANFVGMVADALTQTEFDPSVLHLEITETGIMNDIGAMLETLHALRSLGVQLSIDDFGTGQASLSYLSRLPVQTLKIDRSFVEGLGGEDPRASLILDAIVNLGRALNLEVIAEGVETTEQLQALRRIEAPLGQGFLWSQPLPPEEVQKWLDARLPRV